MMKAKLAVSSEGTDNRARNVINAQIRAVRKRIRVVETNLTIACEWLIGDLEHTRNKLCASDGRGRAKFDDNGIVRGKGASIDNLAGELAARNQELQHLMQMKQEIVNP